MMKHNKNVWLQCALVMFIKLLGKLFKTWFPPSANYSFDVEW